MPLRDRVLLTNPHAQDGLLINVLMDDTVRTMDDATAITGGPTTVDVMPTTRMVVKEKSRVK